jgi:ferric enterobactin receptor
VIETKNEAAIAKASVAVRKKQSMALVAGAIAGMDGSFKVQGLRLGVYSLRVTFIGFAPLVQDVTITPDAPVANLGSIKLSQVAVAIEGVAVSEERVTMTIEPDRNAYKAKDVAPAAGNASEAIDAVPWVSADGDGKVSLRGNENVAVILRRAQDDSSRTARRFPLPAAHRVTTVPIFTT